MLGYILGILIISFYIYLIYTFISSIKEGTYHIAGIAVLGGLWIAIKLLKF